MRRGLFCSIILPARVACGRGRRRPKSYSALLVCIRLLEVNRAVSMQPEGLFHSGIHGERENTAVAMISRISSLATVRSQVSPATARASGCFFSILEPNLYVLNPYFCWCSSHVRLGHSHSLLVLLHNKVRPLSPSERERPRYSFSPEYALDRPMSRSRCRRCTRRLSVSHPVWMYVNEKMTKKAMVSGSASFQKYHTLFSSASKSVKFIPKYEDWVSVSRKGSQEKWRRCYTQVQARVMMRVGLRLVGGAGAWTYNEGQGCCQLHGSVTAIDTTYARR